MGNQITYHMGSHSVTCHPAEATFPPLPQPKLLLNLATPKGCKAELTWVLAIFQDRLPVRDGHLPQKKIDSAVTGIRTHDRESPVRHPKHYTTKPLFGGVVVRMSDFRLAVMGSIPGHSTAFGVFPVIFIIIYE